MVKIAFHDNCLSERGTAVALFDYAYFNRELLHNESIIIYPKYHPNNNEGVIIRVKKEFTSFTYENWSDVDEILKNEKCDFLYLIKGGEWDSKISSVCKNLVHCVFNTKFPHGNVYARISPWVGENIYPVVGHMVHLPDIQSNMREQLHIPNDAIVFGRHGGFEQFDIDFVQNIVDNLTDENKNIYFVFLNTKQFGKVKKNIIFLDKIIDLHEKTKFINTCDAMIHARKDGETFGCSIAEFSIRNKPIITANSGDKAHLQILKDKAFIYNNPLELNKIFDYFIHNIHDIKKQNWNCYDDYSPAKIMNQFHDVFIKPFISRVKIHKLY